ncbi:Uncharacterised protein [Mycobacteroides abscessus]|nr:Uncharacterised protein [Mycobacteroides abscessus]
MVVKPSSPSSMTTDWTPAAPTASMNGCCPPVYARTPCSGATIAGSMGRTERTGPTLSGTCEW